MFNYPSLINKRHILNKFTSVGLVGVRTVIRELLAAVPVSPLSTRRLSPLHAGLLATCYQMIYFCTIINNPILQSLYNMQCLTQ